MFRRIAHALRGRSSSAKTRSRQRISSAIGAVEMLEERRMLSCGGGEMETLVPPTPEAAANMGYSVATKDNLILVGAPHRGVGEAYLFKNDGTFLRTFEASDPTKVGGFGSAVALIGGLVVIGAPSYGQGEVHVFKQVGSDWQDTVLSGADFVQSPGGGSFGAAVAGYSDLSGNDHILITALYGAKDSDGEVWLVKPDGTPEMSFERTHDPIANAPVDEFGSGLAVWNNPNDGFEVLIGARQIGQAFRYKTTGGEPLATYQGAASDFFGESVGFTTAGIAVIGAPGTSGGGAVYVYNGKTDPPLSHPTQVGSFPFVPERFGQSFAIDGNEIVIGAPGATAEYKLQSYDDAGDPIFDKSGNPVLYSDYIPVGAIYRYDLTTGALISSIANPTQPDYSEGINSLDAFGSALASANGRVVVGDPSDDQGSIQDAGGVYVFGGSTGQITASLTGPSQAVRQQPLTFIGSYVTPCGAVLDATWTITNAANQVVASGTGLKVNFVPQEAGDYTVTMSFIFPSSVSATGTASAPDVVATEDATVPVSDTAFIDGTFYVGGTSGADAVIITPTADGVQMYMNGTSATYAFPGDIVIFGGSGLNTVVLSNSVTRPLFYFGGPDTDLVRGGNGGNVIVGNGGADLLVGGSGRDLLIGGRGVDMMVGNANDDILISGTTNYDNDLTSLRAIFTEWSRTDKSYADRVNTLRTEGDTLPALNDDTVFDDGQLDILTGNAGTDWFLFNKDGPGVRDWVTDLGASEFASDIDFITQP